MRVDAQITNFAPGEISPRMKGRTDHEKYFGGCETLQNLVVLPQGGVTRRPGTTFVNNTKGNLRIRVMPFVFSTVQAYIIEFGNLYARFYMNDAQILTGGGAPVEIVTPFATGNLDSLNTTQSADTLYICSALATQVLTRTSHTAWAINPLTFLDGPYLALNPTSTTLTPSATTGAINIVASSPVGINNGSGFLATDVGRALRIKVAARWGWCLITSWTDATHVGATVQAVVGLGADGALDGTTATKDWRLGSFSNTTGWPLIATFFQQRLAFLGNASQPNTLWLSTASGFSSTSATFAPTGADGVAATDNALNWTISDDQVNAIRWASAAGSAQSAQLGIGTVGSEAVLQPATNAQALSATNVQVYRETAYGAAANVNALRIGKSVLFANTPGRRIHEWTFQWQVNGYLGPDLTEISEHITAPGIKQMVYQQNPYSIVWALRTDGQLIGCTFNRTQNMVGWHRHRLGGTYYGGPPIVESLAVIPSPDGTYSELWLTVLRTVNGAEVRFVEVMAPFFDAMPLEKAVFVDAALTRPLTFPAATLTPPASTGKPLAAGQSGTFLASAAVFAAGTVGSVIRANGGVALVTAFTDTTHVIARILIAATSVAPALANAWSCTARTTSPSGLTHLIAEAVDAIGDGADVGINLTVDGGGAIALTGLGGSLVTAGLPYESRLVTMPFEPLHAASSSTQGRVKRIDTIHARFHETVGCTYGARITDPMTHRVDDRTEDLLARSAADPMGQALPLFSGSKRLKVPGGYDTEGQLLFTKSDAFPLTLLSINAKANVSEMPAP